MAPDLKPVLIVDDDNFSRSLYGDLLLEEGYTVHRASSADQAFAILKELPVNVIVTDIVMPNADGFEVLNHMNAHYPNVDVIVLTGYADVDSAVRALKSGAKDYLRKPVNPEEFKLIVQRCFEQQNLFTQNQEFKKFLGLFDACHRISGCLEMDRLLPLSLNALCQELEAADGLVVTRGTDNRTVQALSAGATLDLEQMRKCYLESPDTSTLMDFAKFSWVEKPAYPKGVHATLVLPIVIEDMTRAVFFLFYPKPSWNLSFNQDALKQRAEFIGRQVALSMENAVRFTQARDQAFIDDLTGLYNARFLKVALDRELKRCRRFGHKMSVLFLDLDRFKMVNDQHGHLVGSKILVELAHIIRSCLREIDVAVRYGGDEYTILLVNTDAQGATTVAERIRESIEKHVFLQEDNLNVRTSASIGIACFPDHAQNARELLEMADQAMYVGKNQSRNVVYLFKAAG